MASGCGQSQSFVGVGDSSTNLKVVAIKEKNRNPTIWSNYDLCMMSSGPRKARYDGFEQKVEENIILEALKMFDGEGDAMAEVRRYSSGSGFEGLGGASNMSSRKGLDDVSLVDGVFDGAFGGDGDDDFVIGEGVVPYSLLVKSIKSCLGGIMVSLIFLEGLEGDA
ncbi:hypothetical protein Tco_0916402 [Tanacetum coccineum]